MRGAGLKRATETGGQPIELREIRVEAGAIGLVVATLAYVELFRRAGIIVPVPFLTIYGVMAIMAAVAGMRAGLIGALFVSAYIAYAASENFGPPTLIGGIPQILSAAVLSLVITYFLGQNRDRLLRTMVALRRRETELEFARDELESTVRHRTSRLDKLSGELVDTRHHLENAVRYSPAAVFVVQSDRTVKSENPAALQLLGVDELPDEWRSVDVLLSHFKLFAPDGSPIPVGHGFLTEALENGRNTVNVECRVEMPDGRSRWLRATCTPIRTAGLKITGATVILHDIQAEIVLRENGLDAVSTENKTNV